MLSTHRKLSRGFIEIWELFFFFVCWWRPPRRADEHADAGARCTHNSCGAAAAENRPSRNSWPQVLKERLHYSITKPKGWRYLNVGTKNGHWYILGLRTRWLSNRYRLGRSWFQMIDLDSLVHGCPIRNPLVNGRSRRSIWSNSLSACENFKPQL